MTTGMAWCPVSNMVIIKNKVTDGVTWRPVSHGVSLKGVFDSLVSAKIAKKFFWGSNSVAWVNETIKTILSPFNLFIKENKQVWILRVESFRKKINRFEMVLIASFTHTTHGKGQDISLTPQYQFHPLYRHLDIIWAIAAEGSPLQIACCRNRTGTLWFLSASR